MNFEFNYIESKEKIFACNQLNVKSTSSFLGLSKND